MWGGRIPIFISVCNFCQKFTAINWNGLMLKCAINLKFYAFMAHRTLSHSWYAQGTTSEYWVRCPNIYDHCYRMLVCLAWTTFGYLLFFQGKMFEYKVDCPTLENTSLGMVMVACCSLVCLTTLYKYRLCPMMEAVSSSETSTIFYQTARRSVLWDTLHLCCVDTPRSFVSI
jgi:hypothetical protein